MNLFGVEMWERFSYYGLTGIVGLYMWYSAQDGGLGQSKAAAMSIVGAYGGLIYVSAIVGSWIADRLLGAERTVFYGAVVVVIGHLSLAILPGLVGLGVGLFCVAVGGGALKGNASVIVGMLYEEKDGRRDAGFSIFYMGINIGGLAGTIFTGAVGEKIAFHYGFGLAAIGMIIGLIQYTLGRRNLPESASSVPNPLPPSERTKYLVAWLGLVVVIVLAVALGVITALNLSDVVAVVAGVAAVAYFVLMLTSDKVTPVEKSRVRAFIPLLVASVAFWSLFQQLYTVMPVYAEGRIDRMLFGWEMPVSWVANAINPVFIILLAGVFAVLWTKLGPRQPSTPTKIALGPILVGVGFLLFLTVAGGGAGSVPLLAFFGFLLVFTIAELFISPVGLSTATKLAPEAFRSQMMGLWFLSVAMGSSLAGTIGQYYHEDSEASYFGIVGAGAIVVGLAVLALRPWISKQMSGVR
ncbi:POT family proton-dependent oligopeptide transporter [Herbihabitans rhizosphaerae]|uniref:POT family proton-dependent oligopeptide transporter n=2 Tax=Herbihabitans rhizosphaerae TaxID=1872711 RepID=A0A4Q7KZ43_9PSEU|nr:POT family proton-dependent oligopeptide transporter [Herbihabitans rhizosphaerae]